MPKPSDQYLKHYRDYLKKKGRGAFPEMEEFPL